MDKFDDDEKNKDRTMNRIYLQFKKYNFENECPWCNEMLPTMQKFGLYNDWIHDQDECFGAHAMIIHIEKPMDKTMKLIDKVTGIMNDWQDMENNTK